MFLFVVFSNVRMNLLKFCEYGIQCKIIWNNEILDVFLSQEKFEWSFTLMSSSLITYLSFPFLCWLCRLPYYSLEGFSARLRGRSPKTNNLGTFIRIYKYQKKRVSHLKVNLRKQEQVSKPHLFKVTWRAQHLYLLSK